MSIAKRLKQARLAANMTQEGVAEKVGVSRQTMSNWENGKSYPDIASVITLSDIYGLTLDSLLKGDEKMIKHLKDSTNVVKSNKNLGLSIYASLTALVVVTLIRVLFPEAPLINSAATNILVMMLFVFTLIAYVSKSAETEKFIQQKTSNKTIVKIGAIVLYGLFCIPLILFIPEAIYTDFRIESGIIHAIIRVVVAYALVLPPIVFYRKWNKPQQSV